MRIGASSHVIDNRAAPECPTGILPVLISLSVLLISGLVVLLQLSLFTLGSASISMMVWLGIVACVWRGLPHHSHTNFGLANTITSIRALVTALILGCVPVAQQLASIQPSMWYLLAAAAFALSLDGADGWIARKTNQTSPFGARFDMEIDALLILVLTLVVWQSAITGAWILTLGLMRYAFVAASAVLPALNKPLYPSLRRKIVCVIQTVALCLMLVPWVQAPLAAIIGSIALFCLTGSFARDTFWLLNSKVEPERTM